MNQCAYCGKGSSGTLCDDCKKLWINTADIKAALIRRREFERLAYIERWKIEQGINRDNVCVDAVNP